MSKSKAMDPFSFFAILALVVTLLAVIACFSYPLQPPMARYVITSPFGYRLNPLPRGTGGGDEAFHPGVDLKGPPGCAILAAAPGMVVECWPAPGTPIPGKPGKFYRGHSDYGGYIVIDHGNGIRTKYAHMRTTFVHTGQRVAGRQVIGLQGATGKVTGEHLHFEVQVNPLIFFEPPLGPALRDPRELLR